MKTQMLRTILARCASLLACAVLLPVQAEDSRNGVVTSPNGYANLGAQDLELSSVGGPVRWTRSWTGQEWKFNQQWEGLSQRWSHLTGSQTRGTALQRIARCEMGTFRGGHRRRGQIRKRPGFRR